ncbi:MAG: DUF58 domain-containing protein [Synergistaceae bacterium]|nr:DUF58 domain-containing protein [Synergistaceae bacterium]
MKRIIRVRRSGMVYIIISIMLGVVAVNSANNLLYLAAAVLLGYMLASGLAGRGNILGASVSISFPDEIYAGLPCAVTVTVANKRRFAPLFLIEVVLGGEKRAFFPVIQPGESVNRTLFVTFPARGRHDAGEVELMSVYPFNFFVRYWPVDFKAIVTVFPFPLRCDPQAVFVQLPRDRAGEDAADPLAETDIVGVRPYTEGDSMKRIHWKSSARTGKLKTRLYDGASSRSGRVIDLDRLVAGGVERGLSMAAFAVTESMKARLPVGLRSHRKAVPPAAGRAHMLDLLTQVALYE